jgi:hypothetical protein
LIGVAVCSASCGLTEAAGVDELLLLSSPHAASVSSAVANAMGRIALRNIEGGLQFSTSLFQLARLARGMSWDSLLLPVGTAAGLQTAPMEQRELEHRLIKLLRRKSF